MSERVEILVEASVADALGRLGLVRHEIGALGDAGSTTSRKIGDETDRGSLVSSMGRLEQHLANFSGSGPMGLGTVETGLARLGLAALKPFTAFGEWTASMGGTAAQMGELVTAMGPLAAGIAIVAGAIFLAVGAMTALADTIGTVIAIFADLVAPITLTTALLGGLAAAFVVAAKSAFGQGGALGGQVEILKHQFDNLTKTLVNDFMPVFRFLIDNAHSALTYLNQIAKLPLADAFRSLATTGVQAVSKFLGQVGTMLARPFRLAVAIAFGAGKGGNEVASAVSGLWNQFTDFLLGYTVRHPVELRPGVFKIEARTVDGALQPFIDWFNRHHFTRQGIEIGHDILAGLMSSGMAARMGDFLNQVLIDAAKAGGRSVIRILGAAFKIAVYALFPELGLLTGHFDAMWTKIGHLAVRAFNYIRSNAGSIISGIASTIANLLSRAWTAVANFAQRVWNRIGSVGRAAVLTLIAVVAGPLVSAWSGVMGAVRAVTSLIHGAVGAVQGLISALQGALSIAQSVASAVSLGSSSSTAGRTGMGGNSPGNPSGHVVMTTPNVTSRLAGAGFHVHGPLIAVYGADLTNAAQRRVVGAQLGDEIVRRFQQQAGP